MLQQLQQQCERVGGLQAKQVRSAQSVAAATVRYSSDEASPRVPGGQPRAGAWACGSSGWVAWAWANAALGHAVLRAVRHTRRARESQ